MVARAKIVKHVPKNYPRQQGLTCGESNARTIVESFNLLFQMSASPSLRVRLFGFSFLQDIQSLLVFNGLSAPIRFASKLAPSEMLQILQSHIDQDEPVLLAIGNGHLGRGRYLPTARLFIGHFITLYGYNAEQQIFYIYDPYLEGAYSQTIPIGNEVRTFEEVLRDWSGPFYYKVINMDHVYIPMRAK
jgi:hypothetical protein